MPRGVHLITSYIQESLLTLSPLRLGLAHLFLQHTSASLIISENACSDVRGDLEAHFNRLAPEDNALYQHTLEGEDDMPAHIKNALLGCSLIIPIKEQALLLGSWQGIMLCEHRNHASSRHIVLTIQGTRA